MQQKSSLISSRFEEFVVLNQDVSQKMNHLLTLTAIKDKDQAGSALNAAAATIVPDKAAILDLFRGGPWPSCPTIS
jgi:hypothetical protein